MGAIFPKWRRSQKSSREALEALETSITSLTQSRKKSQQCERSFAITLIMAFLLLYPLILVVGVVIWVWFNDFFTLEVSVVFVLLVALLPIMFYGFKKLINMYFAHRQTEYNLALQMLQAEKKKVLDEVMEKEPYKIAKELLEKYEPSHPTLSKQSQEDSSSNVRRRLVPGSVPNTPRPAGPPSTPHPALRFQQQQRQVATPMRLPATPALASLPQATPQAPPPVTRVPDSSISESVVQRNDATFIPPGHCLGIAPGPPQPVPILPRERTNIDKVVEYILGDGPSNRYALICSNCKSHNGMSLKEEFEYLAFRCAYCYEFNPARKTKPNITTRVSTGSTLPLAITAAPGAPLSETKTGGEGEEETVHDNKNEEKERGEHDAKDIEENES
ncbi:PREDICTED: protein lunapark-like [Amphimedon queenslandica]|uniref:Endoplasmic reticulum junction formation protein lunapark n=1 Tax=Amphimedon queenslandica TaxID=400682 RepID=A0A1X7UHY1_AMPQE|nr:PREDICTED: protein lunapark-like [Amphimedon queenslandica]|eukprot:XP_011405020.1 PREDICTED: protein lunapark-like [Amphimedon queenslandica]